MNSNKLFVGNLPYSTTSETLQELFSQAGTVASAKVITDRESGRSKGFGFVEMATPEEAQKAQEMFNNHELDGRAMIVNEARPQEDRPRSGGFQNDRRGGGGQGGNFKRDKRW